MAAAATIAEHTASLVGAAVLALACEEERIAHEALERTDPHRWASLEWIIEQPRCAGARSDLEANTVTCVGVWPRAIACRWQR